MTAHDVHAQVHISCAWGSVLTCRFSNLDDSRVVLGTTDGTVCVRRVDTLELERVARGCGAVDKSGNRGQAVSCRFSPDDGRILVSRLFIVDGVDGGGYSTVTVLDSHTCTPLQTRSFNAATRWVVHGALPAGAGEGGNDIVRAKDSLDSVRVVRDAEYPQGMAPTQVAGCKELL